MSTVQAFAYRARDAHGKVQRGRVEAPNTAAVVARLRTLGLAPVDITPARANAGLHRDINLAFLPKRVKLKELTVMTRQLATMVGAGLPLIKSLDILGGQTESKMLREVIDEVRRDVETGSTFSDALAEHQSVFPPLMVSLVRAGETGGFLEESLSSAATTYEKDAKLRDTIKSAMTYPVVVLGMAVLGVAGMIIFIVPIFKKMFEGLGTSLPLATQILVDISDQMVWAGPTLVVVIGLVVVWWRRKGRTDAVRRIVDPLKLRLPVFGPLFKKIAIARFSRNLASMTRSGVPILRALSIVGATSGNWAIERALENVQNAVRNGRSIAEPMAAESIFPPMVVQMMSVGEDSGSLETMLMKVADFYDAEVESTANQLTSLIEPLLIAVLGTVIGGMVIALYMPIFTIATAVK